MRDRSVLPIRGVNISEASGHRLSHLQTVPRHMVHRAAVSEVFLTDAQALGGDRFLVAAQWPRDHALYYPDSGGFTDPLLFAETIRQSMVYLAHAYYDVPLTHRFIGSDFHFEITDPELFRVIDVPLQPVLEARWTELESRPPNRVSLRVDVELTIAGSVCGRGSISAIAVDDKRYGLLRRRGAPSAADAQAQVPQQGTRIPAACVGRLREKDCVLERVAGGDWQMRAAVGHAVLFDHPTDHVPLMVMLEGFRQLGHLLTRAPSLCSEAGRTAAFLTAASVDCLAFAEVDAPIRLRVHDGYEPASRGGAGELRVDAVQSGRDVATATTVWAALPVAERVGVA
ncbi:ScbA/BarX family gamma-butyrolactone biosynthesis protein [Streptomyces olivochromogenes]|uniref:ScbA/BarX family gamma-butyrolactone biosynthesis protein n=1 Tax=Streptomyces olivochromogenes TaxID=1963 RepID=UPI00369FF781